jgi:hypothetical protein
MGERCENVAIEGYVVAIAIEGVRVVVRGSDVGRNSRSAVTNVGKSLKVWTKSVLRER